MNTEFKLEVGMVYNKEGASLKIIDKPIKNSVKCQCLVCKDTDNYKVSDLKEGNVLACKKCKKGINVNDNIRGFKVIGYSLITSYPAGKKFGVKLACNNCSKQYFKTPEDILTKKLNCINCSKNSTSVSAADNTKKENTAERKMMSASRQKLLAGNISNFKDGVIPDAIDSKKISMKGDFLILGSDHLSSATGVSVTEYKICQCMKCGTIQYLREKELEKIEYKCNKCGIIYSDRRNIIENTNWVGFTKHNLQVTRTFKDSNGCLTANVKCLLCNCEQNIPMVVFYSSADITCYRCGHKLIDLVCPNCGKVGISTTTNNLYRKRLYDKLHEEKLKAGKKVDKYYSPSIVTQVCRECNKEVLASEVALQHEIKLKLDTIRKNYRNYELEERLPGHDSVPTLYKFTDNYIGTDGKVYYTCMCEQHYKMMVLTEDEMMSYDHRYCADSRMMPYSKKSSIKE